MLDDASIMVAENDAQTIKDFVNNIRLHDGTATHVGMKYGTALLNPDTQPVFEELYQRGEVDVEFYTKKEELEELPQVFVIDYIHQMNLNILFHSLLQVLLNLI